MSRITGTDAFNMMEAYNAVYAPQELTEEQVQEDFENWVNSLVEEGYDLSEYTWEDMYEEYISEIPINPAGNRPISNAPYQSRFARPMNAGTPQTYGGGRSQPRTVRPPVASLPSSARQVTQYPQGVSTGVGGGNASASRQAPAARPASPAPAAARPAAAPAKPPAASTKPAIASAAPTKPATASAATTGNPPLRPPALPPITGKPSLASQAAELRAMQAASRQRQGLTQSFDPFDIVMGYLIDEGYADTEESAAVIMANMSEEWRRSIVEETLDERRNVTDKPLGILHRFARGVRTRKGEKTELMGSDREGNPTGKYLRMKHEKKAAQREKDADEQRKRDSGAMSRGTWDKD